MLVPFLSNSHFMPPSYNSSFRCSFKQYTVFSTLFVSAQVHYPPYLFEAFLFEPVDDDRSTAKIGDGVAVFSLPKRTNKAWEHLMITTSKSLQPTGESSHAPSISNSLSEVHYLCHPAEIDTWDTDYIFINIHFPLLFQMGQYSEMDYLTVTVLYLLQFILSADTNTQNVLSQDKIIRGGGGGVQTFHVRRHVEKNKVLSTITI